MTITIWSVEVTHDPLTFGKGDFPCRPLNVPNSRK